MTKRTDFPTSAKEGHEKQTPNALVQHLLRGLSAAWLGTCAASAAMAQPALPAPNPPPELRSADKWAAFKTLWREVGTIKPAHPDIHPPEGRHFSTLNAAPVKNKWPSLPDYDKRAYHLAIDEKRAIQLQESLFNIFDLPVPNAIPSRMGDNFASFQAEEEANIEARMAERKASIEARMLARLLQLRIQQMSMPDYSTGRTREYEVIGRIQCRAMPPACVTSRLVDVPPSYYMVGAIDRIEARVDALMDLRAKGAISESVFAAALEAIQNDAKLVLFLDALNSAGRGEFGLEKKDFMEPQSHGRADDVDLRNHQIWERAAEASMLRHPRLLRYPPQDILIGGPPNSDETERQKAQRQERESFIKEQASKTAEQIKRRVAELRAAYPRLEALLAELER